MRTPSTIGVTAALAVCFAVLGVAPALAQQAETQVVDGETVGDTPPADVALETQIVNRPNAQLPLDAQFMDDTGQQRTLGHYFQGEKPVVLLFVYYRCPSLCSAFLNSVTTTLKDMDWTAGGEFDIVTISISPLETANLARSKKAAYVKSLGRPEAAQGWHFLSGNTATIRSVTDTVGFGYKFDDESGEYAHSAGIFVCTPDGRLSRTLHGVVHEPDTVKYSLIEAADGKIGTPLDQIFLYCYHYDPRTGVYGAAAMNIMRLAGAITVFLIVLFVGGALVREKRRRAAEDAKLAATPPAPTSTPSTSEPAGSAS
ncbi:SCO family protein [Planctomycetota bacterium]|nr:SCO family protein [Planctomycetota bacterium]